MRSPRASACPAPLPVPEPLTRRPPGRTLRLALLGVVALAIGLLFALAGLDLLRIRRDLEQGQRTLSSLDFRTVDSGGGVLAIADAAAADLERAADRASSSPWLSALSSVPVVGAQVDAVRALTATANEVGQIGERGATDVQVALDRAKGAGPAGRLRLVNDLSTEVAELRQALDGVELNRRSWLLPPLEAAQSKLFDRLERAETDLEDATQSLTAVHDFLAGPRRYLVLGGNNAEMRSTGIATTSGVATIHDGEIEVGSFVYSGATTIGRPGVEIPPAWSWLYGYLDPDIAYSNVVASPNFPVSGDVAARLSARNIHGPVDGVIYVDTMALQALLGVVGPVTVDGITYDATNAVRQLVNENYLRFQNDDSSLRRESQGRVADAIFDAINTRDISFIALASTLKDLAAQRHVAAWSSSTAEQELWADLGADGARRPNDVLVASQDLGASKLDYYVAMNVALTVEGDPAGRRLRLSVTLHNPRRTVKSTYIEGGSIFANPGEYGSYLTVYLPQRAFDIVPLDPAYKSSDIDGDLRVTTFELRVPEGTSRTVDLTFALPADVSAINIVPSARIAPAEWYWVGRARFNDRQPTTLDLRVVRSGNPAVEATWLPMGLLLLAIGAAITGDAWGRGAMNTDGRTTRLASIDANIGWWLQICGAAMVAAQIARFTLR